MQNGKNEIEQNEQVVDSAYILTQLDEVMDRIGKAIMDSNLPEEVKEEFYNSIDTTKSSIQARIRERLKAALS